MHNLYKKTRETRWFKWLIQKFARRSGKQLENKKKYLCCQNRSDGLLSETENLTCRGVIKRGEHWKNYKNPWKKVDSSDGGGLFTRFSYSAWNHDNKICYFLDHEITRSGYKISDFIGAHLESGAELGNKVWDNVDIDSLRKLKSKRSKRD